VSNKLPSVTSDIPRDLRTFIDRLRELTTSNGDNRFVTARELIAGGVVDPGNNGTIVRPGTTVVGTPPAPTNLTAAAAIQNIIVSWDSPQYAGHSHAELWGSSTDNIGVAVLIGLSPGAIYIDSVGPSVTRYYWVRFVNTLNVVGPFNSVNGTVGTTGAAVTYLLATLTNSITSSQLATALNNRINLIDGPAGTAGTIPNQLAQIQGQIDAINSYPTYDNATTYATDAIVKYNGGLYKALSSTTGNLPTNTTYWLKIGDYSSLADIVAAHTSDIATLTTDLGAEVTARTTLASQMRGTYTGTDITSVTTGLIFSEKTARATADAGLASSISSVSATASGKNTIYRTTTAPATPAVNDIWVDIKPSYAIPYFEGDYSTARNNQYQWDGAAWIDITLTDVTDNFALIVNEQTARATADEAFASDITTLETSVNDPVTGLVATRATLINDYSTTSTVNTAIANSKTSLRAYTNVSASRTFRQVSAPTKRGVDTDTTLDIPLQSGDLWIDTDDSNKLYQWSGTAWVYSPDGVITGSVSALTATLTNDYLTQTDTENAIAQSGTFLRAYADIQSKVFRTADAPTKRGVDESTSTTAGSFVVGNPYTIVTTGNTNFTLIGAANSSPGTSFTATGIGSGTGTASNTILLQTGDVWYDTNDSNKLYLWTGSAWVYSPDAVITGSVSAVDSRVTTVESTKIGYCTIDGAASDNTNKDACEAAGGTWNVGIPIATAVKQVNVSDGSNSATLEQRFTAQKTNNDVLLAQYTVKLEVNGYVSGFGLASTAGDSSPTTDFIINANKFAVAAPMFVGATAPASPFDGQYWRNSSTGVVQRWNAKLAVPAWETRDYKLPLAVLTTSKTINDVAFSPGVYIDGANITTATIGSAQIGELAVDDAKIAAVSVGKLTAGSIATDQYIQSSNYVANTQGFRLDANGNAYLQNAVIRGTVFATDGQFVGEVIAEGVGGNRARMWAGNFEVYKNVPSVGVTLYKALSRFEAGVGVNNVALTIPGYFSAQPKIIVSPANIKLYDAGYANQSQSLQCEALSIVETSAGSMVWQFTPRATLSLAANAGQTVLNQTSGTISTGWTSSSYTTEANTVSISPNVTLSSTRGTGVAGNYYLRTVRWKVEYFSGGVWVSGSWTTTNLSAVVSASITTNATFTFPSAGTWVFRIVTEAFDTGGTFTTGTEYETVTDSVSRSGVQSVTANTSGPTSVTLTYTPTYSLPSGWSYVSSSYTYIYSYSYSVAYNTTATISGGGLFITASGPFPSGTSGSASNLSKTYTGGLALSINASATRDAGTNFGTVTFSVSSLTGTVTRRRPLTNSTTASNSFSFNYYDFSLTAAQVLATGSLNWLAIGE
jgi:hypothetical protein